MKRVCLFSSSYRGIHSEETFPRVAVALLYNSHSEPRAYEKPNYNRNEWLISTMRLILISSLNFFFRRLNRWNLCQPPQHEMWATNPLLCPFDHIFIFELDLTGKEKSIFTNFPVSSRLRTKLTSTGEIELFSRASAVLQLLTAPATATQFHRRTFHSPRLPSDSERHLYLDGSLCFILHNETPSAHRGVAVDNSQHEKYSSVPLSSSPEIIFSAPLRASKIAFGKLWGKVGGAMNNAGVDWRRGNLQG